MITNLILVTLLVIVGLFSYAIYKIIVGVRFLTKERLETYVNVLEFVHDTSHQMRAGGKRIRPNGHNETRFDLIASYPTMTAYGDAYEAFTKWNSELKQNNASVEVAAAKVAADQAISVLYVAMRNDLSIGGLDGRVPNLEVFRARQNKRTGPEKIG